jgi:hypothetical protein
LAALVAISCRIIDSTTASCGASGTFGPNTGRCFRDCCP